MPASAGTARAVIETRSSKLFDELGVGDEAEIARVSTEDDFDILAR